MIHLITELSKYVMIILFAIYTWYSYVVLVIKMRNGRNGCTKRRQPACF